MLSCGFKSDMKDLCMGSCCFLTVEIGMLQLQLLWQKAWAGKCLWKTQIIPRELVLQFSRNPRTMRFTNHGKLSPLQFVLRMIILMLPGENLTESVLLKALSSLHSICCVWLKSYLSCFQEETDMMQWVTPDVVLLWSALRQVGYFPTS